MTQKFRLHVLSLSHTQTTKEWSACAYTEKVRKFCDMMKSLGHTVYLYASEDNEAECDELITCITKQEQKDFVGVEGPADILKAPFDVRMPHWQVMNRRAIEAMQTRVEPRDIICLIAGGCQKPVAEAFPGVTATEFGIGYSGVFSNFRVFESYAWMHMIYGWIKGVPGGTQGDNYDRVIPNYFEPELFPFGEQKDDYLLFMGRLQQDKGIEVAIQTAEKLGSRLLVAGQGEFPLPDWVEYKGLVGVQERGELMSKARAVFTPTLYIEPFAGVHVESMLCGTPVITTDWGVFPETVQQGITGFRCRTFKEFLEAAQEVDKLDYGYIRQYAIERFAVENVRWQYQKYFEDLDSLWDKGWYTLDEKL